MPTREQVQLEFSGGANAQGAEHAIRENEVVTATNVDFGIEDGAASVRRGSTKLWSAGGAVYQIVRRYVSPISSSPFYVLADSTVKRAVDGTFTAVATGATAKRFGYSSYKNHAYIAVDSGPAAQKDSGSGASKDWIKTAPTAAPTVTVSTLTALSVVSSYSIAEGTGGASGGTASATTAASGRVQISATLTGSNLNLNGTNTIGDYGVDYLTVMFDAPSKVRKVSRDYSIGDNTFTNYYHTEMDVEMSDEAVADPEALVDSLLTLGTNTTDGIDEETRAAMTSWVKTALRAPRTRVSAAKDAPNVWAVPRPNFEFIGPGNILDGWANIGAARVVVECDENDVVLVTVKDWQIKGAETYPLTDPDLGIVWWETFAVVDAVGNVIDETAPSAPSARARIQNSRAIVVSNNTTSDTDITHRIFYRQGGYLRSPYPVGTLGISTATLTDTSDDIKVLSVKRNMPIDLLPKDHWPNNVVAVSEPFHDRLFALYENRIRWCKPGNPTGWPRLSEATVSHAGDTGQAAIVWGRLVIVNRDSVYEMDGSIFEGEGQDWVLQRSGSRRGSFAPNTIIKTPHGIPLLDWDGIYMYMPGQGIDVEVSWAMERLADAFRGVGSTHPAAIKGNRVPGINLAYLQNSSAAWADEKLYLAIPTGSDQYPTTLFVLDFRRKAVQWHSYPFNISSLFWDREANRLLAGTTGGSIMQIETGVSDATDAGGTQAISWSVKTRLWTAPSDAVLENVKMNHVSQGAHIQAIQDGTASSLGTFTATSRVWTNLPLSGATVRSLQFAISGSRNASTDQGIFGISWDAMLEPARVQYFKSEYFDNGYPGEKLWDVLFQDIEVIGSGTATSVAYVDGTAVGTTTIVGPTAGKITHPFSLPANTFGNVAYTITTASGSIYFKPWDTRWAARNEPARVNSWTSDRTHKENPYEWKTFEAVLNPNGTATGVVFLDGTNLGTYTFVGTQQQSFAKSLPPYSFGRTIWAQYTGTAFKHYLTWFEGVVDPDITTSFVTEREHKDGDFEWRTVEAILDPMGTCTGTVYVDGTAVMTATFEGTRAQSYPLALLLRTFGRTAWVLYTNVSGFKHYKTWFDGTAEPGRVLRWRVGPVPLPIKHNLRTWIPILDPLGHTVVGTVYADGLVLATESFSGPPGRQAFSREIDMTSGVINTAKVIEAEYVGTAVFKHYDTKFETESRPFGKRQWTLTYKKLGGASQLDMAVFFGLDIHPVGTATITAIWDMDGAAFQTNTLTFSSEREFRDRIPFAPGGRFKLIQLRLSSTQTFEVYRAWVDTMRDGIKDLTRAGAAGAPNEETQYVP